MDKPAKISDINWDTHKFTEEAVLTFIRKDGKLLLIHKKRGLGAGKINAPGGRIDPGETAMEAAVRETQEEVGLTPYNLVYSTELNFIFWDGYSLKGYVFIADSYSGEMVETDEADPFWIDESIIPYGNMWADDEYWIPRMLTGEFVKGLFIFDEDRMVDMSIEAVEK
jgi:8-oxo-dGTP diphosphatase